MKDSLKILKKYDVIGVNEGDFFPDRVEVCEESAAMKKIVIIDYSSIKWRLQNGAFPSTRIISKADKIKFLKAYCFNYHKDAKFSLCIVQSNETVLISAGEAYKSTCREFNKYFSMVREKGNLNINEIIKKRKNNDKEKDL